MGSLTRSLLALSYEDVSFEKRRFRGGGASMRERLEKVGGAFVDGFNAALANDRQPDLVAYLEGELAPSHRGFAYEGAAMALTVLDLLTPWRRDRFTTFLEGPADPHVYMAHVGAGWVMARIPWSQGAVARRLDPLLRWLAYDGYGFHQGFFHWPDSIAKQRLPRSVRGYSRRAFDQGVGRSLWFVDGGDVERIAHTISTFSEPRRTDLWAGIGLSSTYAGGVGEAELTALLASAGPYRPMLAQGSAFATEARVRAGNMTPATELACRVLTGLATEEAAGMTEVTRRNLPEDGEVPAYEVWKKRIQETWREKQAVA